MTIYAVGDIQGCDRALKRLLQKVEFDPKKDRLWLVGDLVNRGPDSLGVMRRLMSLGDSVTAVLGNHDLHLLAAAAGYGRHFREDTFADILNAPDADDIIDWLRERPLLYKRKKRLLVHAGIPPRIPLNTLFGIAEDVSNRLRGPRWHKLFKHMYGDTPRRWSPDLRGKDRRRFVINGLTRMRFVTRGGSLDFSRSGPPGTQRTGLVPWFEVAARRHSHLTVVCGHWAALGYLRKPGLIALDSGCVWGNCLTALPLNRGGGKPIRIKCRKLIRRAA